MPSNYPAALDSLTNPVSTDALTSPAHASQHADANDAIEAIEATLGTDPQGAYATVKARLAVVDLAAGSAAASAASAAVSATSAAGAAVDAGAAANSAVTAYDNFDDRYLGAKSSAPTVDNDGNALLTGALYWNSTSSQMFVYTGSTWQTLSAASVPQSISVSSSSAALSITQTGAGDALLVEDSASTDSTPFVIRADGSVGIGTATPAYKLDVDGTVNATALFVGGTAFSSLPTQTGNSGRYLTTNGTAASWAVVDSLPSQTGNSGRYLTTDGTNPSWASVTTDPTPTVFLLMGA